MTEPVILVSMIVAFIVASMVLGWAPALATSLAAVTGALVAGTGFPTRHLVEGTFCYLDVILVIATAMIFMKSLERAGIIDQIARSLYSRFGGSKFGLLLTSAFLVMCPGMITGSSTAAALTTGGLVAPVLIEYGFDDGTVGSLIALWSILGMVAPPVNIPAMLIGGGVDMPFAGFDLPLLAITGVLALVTVAFGCLCGRRRCPTKPACPERERLAAPVRPPNPTGPAQPAEPAEAAGPAWPAGPGKPTCGTGIPDRLAFGLLPIFVVVALILGPRLWPLRVPDLGMPLTFTIGAILAAMVGRVRHRRFDVAGTWQEGVTGAIPVMGILAAAGMFIQIMTLTGVRGYVVSLALSIPGLWRYVAAGLALPALGAVSSYASSSVLGVPFLLAMLGQNDIMTTSAMSLVVAVGDILPPVAIVPSLIAQSMRKPLAFRFEIICRSWPAILMILACGVIVMWQARLVGGIFSP